MNKKRSETSGEEKRINRIIMEFKLLRNLLPSASSSGINRSIMEFKWLLLANLIAILEELIEA